MKNLKYILIITCLSTVLTACSNLAPNQQSTSAATNTETKIENDNEDDSTYAIESKVDEKDSNNTNQNQKDDSNNNTDSNTNSNTDNNSNKNTDNTNKNTDNDSDSNSKDDSQKKPHGTLTDDPSATPFEAHGKLAVSGTGIVDANGQPFQLKGVSTHGIGWFPQYVNADAFTTIRDDWKANCVRLAMYSDEGAGYCTGGDKASLKQTVENGVTYATNLGMYVIIDWHVLGEQDPNRHKTEAKEFFQEMSAKYADYDNVLYEICNEPNGNTSWSSIKSYAEEVIPVIRENDPDALIIVGTPTWSQDVDIAAKDPLTDYTNILYTIHFYAGTHKEDLRKRVKSALDSNLPLFCSEFGICDASGNGSCNETEADKWIELFNDNNVSYCIWNLSNKNESSALIKATCNKTGNWTSDDLSQEGKWFVKTLGGKAITKSSEKPGSTTPSGQTQTNSTSGQTQTGSASVNISSSNSWNDGTYDFAQFNVTIENSSIADVSNWSVHMEFDQEILLEQSWNGAYEVNGNSMTISPAEYNSSITSGSTLGDIGFIIKSSTPANVTKIELIGGRG